MWSVEETQERPWTSECVSVPLPLLVWLPAPPSSWLCFLPPHVVSLTSLGRLSRLLALADALRKKLEYHTRWACNSLRGLFLLDVPLPSRFLHRKPNPFIFIIKVASAPKPHSCWGAIPWTPRLLGCTAGNSLELIPPIHRLLSWFASKCLSNLPYSHHFCSGVNCLPRCLQWSAGALCFSLSFIK